MEANATIVIYALMGILIALAFWIMRLERRINKLLYGKDAKSLEDTIINIREGIERLRAANGETAQYLSMIEKRLRKSIRGVETIRFNPFKESGSNQSFATAFLNEEGDGVVLSSLYSRERVSVYAKPIKRFISQYELSEEEKEALQTAQQTLKQ
jgi:hypothetical protein